MMRALSLGLFLLLFWLALSGHYTPFLIVIGALSAMFAVWMAQRMGTLDAEGHPMVWILGAPFYFAWLIIEIMKSSLAVSWKILQPRLTISPTMTTVKARQISPVGIATFGNSITLTPGTITTAIDGDQVTVHALTREGARDIEFGEMNRRVAAFEGRR
jgi:multicomponent Na+:H+ antiporter subunit E